MSRWENDHDLIGGQVDSYAPARARSATDDDRPRRRTALRSAVVVGGSELLRVRGLLAVRSHAARGINCALSLPTGLPAFWSRWPLYLLDSRAFLPDAVRPRACDSDDVLSRLSAGISGDSRYSVREAMGDARRDVSIRHIALLGRKRRLVRMRRTEAFCDLLHVARALLLPSLRL